MFPPVAIGRVDHLWLSTTPKRRRNELAIVRIERLEIRVRRELVELAGIVTKGSQSHGLAASLIGTYLIQPQQELTTDPQLPPSTRANSALVLAQNPVGVVYHD